MDKALAIIHYTTALTVFKKWLTVGIIHEDELIKIEMAIADKYGLSKRSIYRQNA